MIEFKSLILFWHTASNDNRGSLLRLIVWILDSERWITCRQMECIRSQPYNRKNRLDVL